jgi:acyl-CoA dehydrogenase
MKVLEKRRIHIAAICVGMARRMLDDALRHAMARKQFGQPIAEFQLVQAMLADSKAEVCAAHCMVIDAARKRDEGRERFYRDARLFRIYEGTTQIQQIVIARNMVREAS